MTRDELGDRILELFPALAEVEPWTWDQTDQDGRAIFTGLDDGTVDLTGPIPNTTLVGVYRIDPDNHYELVGLADDPIATEAADQGPRN